jgi:uncharacterized membrane protein
MAFCGNCGAQVAEGTSFCGSCGAPVGGAAPAAAPTPTYAASSGMASNVAGLLAYVLGPITGTAFLLIEPYRQDKFVRFHAFQSIFLSLAVPIFFSALGIVISLLTMVTFGLAALLHLVITLPLLFLLFIYWLFLLYKAYSNERHMIPYLGTIAASAADLPATSSNVNGFLAYVLGFITGIILLLSESTKQDKFVRFHAFQSIFFTVAMFVLMFAYWLISLMLAFGTVLVGGFFFIGLLFRLVWLALFAYYLLVMSKAYRNEVYKVPVLGDLAAKQAGV